ncbi:hypothetical protein [Mucilaginibacter phyllosphaerae]
MKYLILPIKIKTRLSIVNTFFAEALQVFVAKNKFPLRSLGTSLGAIYSFGSLGFRLFILLPFRPFSSSKYYQFAAMMAVLYGITPL